MTMQAVLVHDGAVSIGEAPMPTIAAGEVLVRVRATALNRADLLQRAGSYPPPPGESEILGLELAGEVAQVVDGDTSHSLRVGERVCALVAGGGYAQYARVAASSAIRVPEWMSVEQAAALPEAWMTAYQALHWVGGLARLPTKNVLIHAGASGVGLAAIQLAKLQPGVRVLVTAGSQDKLDACIRLGADVGINYKEGDFAPKVLEATSNQGVDLILDFIGASYWAQNLASLAIEGRLVLLGTMGGSVAGSTEVGAILRKRLQVLGTTLRARTKDYKAQLANEMSSTVMPLLQDGRLVLQIDRVFPWTQVDDAHRHMSSNSNIGKIVMLVD